MSEKPTPQGSGAQAEHDLIEALQSGQLTYEQAKNRYRELGAAIQRRYEREITAVSVDVVKSRQAKTNASDLDAQLTFDAYHRWVNSELSNHAHRTGSWSGDGLLALFENPQAAIWFAQSLLDGLTNFNDRFNRLKAPLQIRIGVHTGKVLPAEQEGPGLIASRTFDLAGHLQKAAAPGQMLISDYTHSLLQDQATQFVQVHRSLVAESHCFAYPPYSIHVANDEPAPQPAGPQRRQAGLLPWVLAAAAFALVVAVVGVLALRPGPVRREGLPRQDAQPIVVSGGDEAGGLPSGAATSGAAAPAGGANGPSGPGAGTPPDAAAAASASPAGVAPDAMPWRSPAAASSVPVQLNVSPPEQRWALAIGVSRYADARYSAPGAGRDARIAAELLQQSAGVPLDHVRILVDQEATRSNIAEAFRWLQSRATSGTDTVYVYLGGHAEVVPGMLAGQPAYAFLPFEAQSADLKQTAITGRDLVAWTSATRSQAAVLIVDTPHAAGIELLQGNDPGRRFAVLAAAGVNESEVRAKNQAASPLVQSLFVGVRGGGDLNGDGLLMLDELAQFVSVSVGRLTGNRQSPRFRAGLTGAAPALPFTLLGRAPDAARGGRVRRTTPGGRDVVVPPPTAPAPGPR